MHREDVMAITPVGSARNRTVKANDASHLVDISSRAADAAEQAAQQVVHLRKTRRYQHMPISAIKLL